MDRDVLREAQHKCLDEGIRMNAVIEQLLQLWVNDEVELTSPLL
jgi:hypothetical protein